jgi:hypothetical protein
MNYKSILLYLLMFIIGLIVGKTVKVNVRTGGCPVSKRKLEEIRRMLNSESSEDYL